MTKNQLTSLRPDTPTIYYTTGYKHLLSETVRCTIGLELDVETSHIKIREGQIIILAGYAWDGASGPAIDSRKNLRGSLVHDALYQLIRQGELPEEFRKFADRTFRQLCREDGLGRFRAWYYYRALRWFGRKAASPDSVKLVLTAPPIQAG